jgi:hypothetical protein
VRKIAREPLRTPDERDLPPSVVAGGCSIDAGKCPEDVIEAPIL